MEGLNTYLSAPICLAIPKEGAKIIATVLLLRDNVEEPLEMDASWPMGPKTPFGKPPKRMLFPVLLRISISPPTVNPKLNILTRDRKSTRLNSSHVKI